MKKKVSGFKRAVAYVVASRVFIYIGLGLFFFSALVAFSFPSWFSGFNDTLRQLVMQTQGMNWIQLFMFIFRNNLLSAFFALFLGILFGVVPIFNALLNGAVLGYVVARTIPIAGVASLWRLLPHGIFELPAIFIAIGLGIKMGAVLFKVSSRSFMKERISASLDVFVYIILPLLFVAAVIEATLILLF